MVLVIVMTIFTIKLLIFGTTMEQPTKKMMTMNIPTTNEQINNYKGKPNIRVTTTLIFGYCHYLLWV